MRGRDDSTERTDLSELRSAGSVLVLHSILPGTHQACVLVGGRLRLGRGEENDLCLLGNRVSRRHAELYRQGPLYALRDLGSTNGTFVDGSPVQHCAVRPGMLVRFGGWLGVVEELDREELPRTFEEQAPGLFGGVRLARVMASLRRFARSDLPLVLVGATGAGKELFARACHVESGRQGPFYALNCAALPLEMAEGELFGYRRGAFTGAERSHDGHLRAASGGTLFLDEVADLPLPIQGKLLRAIERQEVVPLGDTRAQSFQTRLVAASQRSLSELVSQGKFREDLAARLSGAELRLPTLGERIADVPSLFRVFLARLSGGRPPEISTRLYEALCLHPWPGNVRELELLARRLLAEWPLEPVLRRRMLPSAFQRSGAPAAAPASPAPQESRRDHDLRRLLSAMRETGGNLSQAAERVGVSRQRAYRLMRRDDEAASTPREEGAGGANGSAG